MGPTVMVTVKDSGQLWLEQGRLQLGVAGGSVVRGPVQTSDGCPTGRAAPGWSLSLCGGGGVICRWLWVLAQCQRAI